MITQVLDLIIVESAADFENSLYAFSQTENR